MDILQHLKQVSTERGIPLEELGYELELALAVAYKKFKGTAGEVTVRLDSSVKSGAVIDKEIVGEVLEPATQISLDVAMKRGEDVQIGDFLAVEIDPNTFGRIAAQTFKQVLAQKLREVELRQIHDQFSERVGEIVSGIISRHEESSILVQVDRHEVRLPRREQVGTDDYRQQVRLCVYVLKIEETNRGFEVIVSRSHPNLLRKLLEREVPEIADGIVEIKAIAREPGMRCKVAVISHDERIDAVGSCVGPRGSRIQVIMDELRPEKIDVVPWSDDSRTFITSALSPAKVNLLVLNEEERSAYAVVPDNQLSLAIGRGGQNVRLAARMTDWKIDIRSEEQASAEGGPPKPTPAKAVADVQPPKPDAEDVPKEDGATEVAATEDLSQADKPEPEQEATTAE